jgi:hypothetical protein
MVEISLIEMRLQVVVNQAVNLLPLSLGSLHATSKTHSVEHDIILIHAINILLNFTFHMGVQIAEVPVCVR